MRISMVSEHASPLAVLGGVDAGGQNVHVAELSKALVRRGHDVTVYTRREDPAQPDRLRAPDGYTVVHVPAGPPRYLPKDELLQYMAQFAVFLQADWQCARPDVVHAHFWMSGLATVLATQALELPTVQTFHALGTVKRRHQGAADTSPSSRIAVERMIADGVSRIAATCTDEVFELIRMGVPRDRTSVVPCGVDVARFTPGPRTPGRRLLAVGRLVPRKGFDLPIRALRDLPDTELTIVGGPAVGALSEDPEAQRLQGIAEECGVADRVHLRGKVDRSAMPEVLRGADAVLCTPWYEPFGIVPLEAMACGIPVIASAVGGMLDTVVDGETGTLVPARDIDALTTAIGQLLDDPDRGAAYGAAGRARAVARYAWDRIASDSARVYRRVTDERPTHAAKTS